MKRVFLAFEMNTEPDEDGNVYAYLVPATHQLLRDKEFVNEGQFIETVRDHNRDVKNPDSKVFGEKPFAGEVVLLQTLTFN